MKLECQRWHVDCLETHKSVLFNTLLHPHNIVSDNLKEIEFEGFAPVRGYFAKKEKTKYWVDEDLYDMLPFRVTDQVEELLYKEDVVIRPLSPRPFKIVPEDRIPIREMIDGFAPFEHSYPTHWLIAKILALMGYIGKTFICISSNSEFGKSSVFELMHGLTDKCPVFQPRSIPGVLIHVNGVGNIVFDEVHKDSKDVIDIIEKFSLQVAGGKPSYINGALASHNLKAQYDTVLQSITFLYNEMGYYRNAEKDFFEFLFRNNKAMDTRFLKFKLDGRLIETFAKDFDIPLVAENNKHYYIDFAKTLLHLQSLKQRNGYVRRWKDPKMETRLRGRKKQVFDEITWLVDMYCRSQEEYSMIVQEIDGAIGEYEDMIRCADEQRALFVQEEQEPNPETINLGSYMDQEKEEEEQ